ncbi:hypothetical protein [Burkholderia ubonensis]|uniref:hypothetical protein n=1 Tax=Burkholderia ubonensis TaxID=101571 RepID=UPI0012FC05C6|nr:hypothetical protein [Burkholderia ubonensis]
MTNQQSQDKLDLLAHLLLTHLDQTIPGSPITPGMSNSPVNVDPTWSASAGMLAFAHAEKNGWIAPIPGGGDSFMITDAWREYHAKK